MIQRRFATSFLLFAGLLSACSADDGPGFYYSVQVVGTEDTCNTPLATSNESFDYRMAVAGGNASVYADGVFMADGDVSACSLSYSSSVYSERRGDFLVRWILEGEATVTRGEGCAEAGDGWTGTETFRIVESNDPDVERGCTYTMAVTGTFDGEVL